MRFPALAMVPLLLPGSAAADCLVAIDIGHHREAPGAISARGESELHFNTALAQRLHRFLQGVGVPSLVINPDAAPIALADRPRAAAEAGASLFIAIHHDSVQEKYLSTWTWEGREYRYSDRYSGYGLFVSGKNPAYEQSLAVATRIGDELLARGLRPSLHHAEAIAGENRPLVDGERGIYRFDDLVVLKTATMPAVLVEAGIIVNRADELTVRTIAYQDKLIAAIAGAAAAHCDQVQGSAK
jgi:N-acetylmuramoyl-L-alanine amidase